MGVNNANRQLFQMKEIRNDIKKKPDTDLKID